MSARKLYAVLVLCLAMCVAAIGQQRWVTGEYRNEALGFAVRIPRGLRGLAGDEAGPERGVQISLGSSTLVAVYGDRTVSNTKHRLKVCVIRCQTTTVTPTSRRFPRLASVVFTAPRGGLYAASR